MKSVKIMLEVGMPEPQEHKPAPKEKVYKPSVEDKVREAIECINSGHDSRVEWMMLNRMYRDLCALRRPNERAKNIMQMIEKVLAHFGYHKVSANQFNGN